MTQDRRRNRAVWAFLVSCAIAGLLVLSIFTAILPPSVGIVAVAIVLVSAFWLLRTHLPSILLVFMGVLLVSVVVTGRVPKLRRDRMHADEGARLSQAWKASGKFDERLPIVVHMVFDELTSVGAMTDDLPGASTTRQMLLDLGDKYSFRTYGSIYSRSYYTAQSIPQMMNAGYLGRTEKESFVTLPFDEKAKRYSIVDNVYFDDMAARGYRTVVFQATYMNFCANKNVDLCQSFDSFDPGGKNVDSPTLRVSLWQTIFRAYGPSYTSKFGERILARVYDLDESEVGVSAEEGGRYDVQRFPEWFDRFTRFTASVPRGTHVFAHFLVPHAPYLLQDSCVLGGTTETPYSLTKHPPSEQETKRRDFYARYFAQVRCVGNELDRFMAALEQSPEFRDAVIIIHGDHGARISRGEYLEDLFRRDYVDNFATFFAVRSPGVAKGLDCEFTSLPEVFRRYAARDVRTVHASTTPLPVLPFSRDAGHVSVEARMPHFGCAPETPTASP